MPTYTQQELVDFYRLTRAKEIPQPASSIKIWYTALAVLLCLPIVFTTYIPLVDYPNHLARTNILAWYQQVASFQKNYRLLFQPIPNLAMDLIVPPIAGVMGTIVAGKLFLIALMLVYATGCFLLAAQIFGRVTLAAFVPLLLIYNSTFLMGFINYAAGIAMFTLTFALWLRWKAKWTFARFAAFTALTSTCYLFHLSAIVILGLCIFAVVSWDVYKVRSNWMEFVIASCATLPAVCAYLAFMRGSGQIGEMTPNTYSGKLIGLLCVIRSYDLGIDLFVILGLVACIAYLMLNRISVSVHPAALLPALLLLAAFAACPCIMYTSSGADARFVWPAFILLALSFRLRVPVPQRTVGLSVVVALFLLRFVSIWWHWHQEDVKAAEIVRSFDKLPRNATLYAAFFNTGNLAETKQNRGLEHVACYAVITRDAFVPTVFALRGQQPLVFKGAHPFHVWDKKSFNPNEYQYMWTFRPPQELVQWLNGSAVLIARTGDSALWKLSHQQSVCANGPCQPAPWELSSR